jgi:hypothetical protein
MSALDTAVYWIEYAARNANYTFRAPVADVPLYKYLNLDVIGVFLAAIIIILSIVKYSTSACRCCKKSDQARTQMKKKKQKKN